ncbi:MAG: Lrp/AsnC family transcriptional regulator [Ruminococcaceae bacterium]|nr:Lrp/AsnC family transcriptional regulator [Oscillospiraceae bacterium]
MSKNEKILEILERNSDASHEQIAIMLDLTLEEVETAIKKYEEDGVILKHGALINWEKTDKEFVTAMIELKVTPQRGEGFDKIAERIYRYPEVKSLYLMAGAFDLTVVIEGKTMKEVALFVSDKIAPMECVLSTATHFVLKKYKDNNVIFEDDTKDDRQVITL